MKKETTTSQPDQQPGYSYEKEDELLKKAREKYQTPEDLRKGIGWTKEGPGIVEPEYHKTPSRPKLQNLQKSLTKNVFFT